MNTIYSIIFFSIISFCLNAQNTSNLSVKTIVQQRAIYLNGGARSAVGGKSRTTIKIDLPANTKSWYYSFSTTPDESGTRTLNLALQLSSLLVDQTGLSKNVISNIQIPPGSGSIDVFILNQVNADLFIDKEAFSYLREGFVENTRQAVVDIDDVTNGTCYVGIKNPSEFNGINIFIEVAAIIENPSKDGSSNSPSWKSDKKPDKLLWDDNAKEYFMGQFKSDYIEMKLPENYINEYAVCVYKSLSTKKTLEQIREMSDDDFVELKKSISDSCLYLLQGGVKTEEQLKGKMYGDLGWKTFENGDIDKAIELSKKAISLDNSLGKINANLGLYYLIKGDDITSSEYYINAISQIKKNKISAKNDFKIVIDNISNALEKYPDLKGYKEILQLLQEEYNKL